jgi:hypothetical protein
MYHLHPDEQLRLLFEGKPYQGAAPEEARFVFLGLDANYDAAVDRSVIYPRLLEYLDDGPAFWREHAVHHPFLLPGYRGDGRLYHRTFAKIGFTAAHAGAVCFAELLHLPTYGRSALEPRDLSDAHLRRLDHAIRFATAEHVFVPRAVAALMRKSGRFPWLPEAPRQGRGPLSVWYGEGKTTVHCHLHFSVYGKFEERKSAELLAMRSLLHD